MGFRNFRINIFIRILILVATIFLLVVILLNKPFVATPLLLSAFLFFQIFSLIQYVEKSNKAITHFLQSVRYSDFSRTFSNEGFGDSFESLKTTFNEVIADFQKIRAEKEEHFFYIQNIIQHVGVGIIAFKKDGEVEMVNNAAKKLFQIYSLSNIRELSVCSDELVGLLINIKAGENKLIKVQDEEDLLQLTIFATEFKLNDRVITLVSIKNIQAELEAKEMESWQKLIRVLTHEIMNSIAPIASLASTLELMVEQPMQGEESQIKFYEGEIIDDIRSGLQAINKRSTGLIHFVETYRNLTRIPKPNFTIFFVSDLFENIKKLLIEDFRHQGIDFESAIYPSTLELTADEQLIEQVLINLVKNSIHATENKEIRTIKLNAFMNKRDRICIQVIDNGQGILKDVIDKVFIPFFTTKPTGSGIGLSLSKQIMRLHTGSISVQSEPDVTTVFTLTF